MSRRYRFTCNPSSRDFMDECTSVLDTAIDTCKKLSHIVAPVWMVDTDSSPHVMRGVARCGRFSWLSTCKRCSGAGEVKFVAASVGGLSLPPVTKQCDRCRGLGRSEDSAS